MLIILPQSLSNFLPSLGFFVLGDFDPGSLQVDFIILKKNAILDLKVLCSPQFDPDSVEFVLQNADVLLHAHHLPLVVLDVVVGHFDHPLSYIILQLANFIHSP